MRNYIINYVMRTVPHKLLRLLQTHPMETLGSTINKVVIHQVLLTDLNLIGGRSHTMNVRDAIIYSHTDDEIILEIPLQFRDASNITSAQMIFQDVEHRTVLPSTRIESQYDPIDVITGNSGIGAYTDLTVINKKYISIRQEDIVLDTVMDSKITFEVEYSEDFDGIAPAYHPDFAELAKLITEMLLYNLELEVDEAYGHNSRVSEKLISRINSYENSTELYNNEKRRTMAKFSFLNNRGKKLAMVQRSV